MTLRTAPALKTGALKPVRAMLGALAAGSMLLAPWQAAFAQSQERGPSLLRDTEIEEILHQEVDPIFVAAKLDPKRVRILLVGDPTINAFATQGLQIGLNTGTILQADYPNEVIGVLAHETGHLAGGHPVRSGEMTRAGLKPMLLTMGLGVLAMALGAPDAGAVLIGNSGYFGTLGALTYSREQESRADQAGVGFLEAAGMSGEGLVSFFDKFRYQEVLDESRRYPFFRSHPLSSDRIEALRHKVEALPHFDVKDSPEAVARFEIMKAKIDGFMNPALSLRKYSDKDPSFPARYARAIAYYQTREPDRALKLIETMLVDQPNNAYLYELKGQILFEYGRIAEAEAPQRKSVELKPDAALLRINLGQTLTNLDDKTKQAEGVAELKRALLFEDDNAEAWRLLALAYARDGDEGQAELSTAEQYFVMGALADSRQFAIRARQEFPKDSIYWRRATDIILASDPTDEDLRALARDGST
jgi:predicted Zn-dependent protease